MGTNPSTQSCSSTVGATAAEQHRSQPRGTTHPPADSGDGATMVGDSPTLHPTPGQLQRNPPDRRLATIPVARQQRQLLPSSSGRPDTSTAQQQQQQPVSQRGRPATTPQHRPAVGWTHTPPQRQTTRRRVGETEALALQQQIQLIHDVAEELGGTRGRPSLRYVMCLHARCPCWHQRGRYLKPARQPGRERSRNLTCLQKRSPSLQGFPSRGEPHSRQRSGLNKTWHSSFEC